MKLNKEQDVILTIHPDYQKSPFQVTGPYDAVTPIAEHVQALDAQTPIRTTKLGKAVIQAPEGPQVLDGRTATLHAKLYDMVNGSNMYELLKQKRQDERNLAMARRLGLVTTTHCAKHEKALAELK